MIRIRLTLIRSLAALAVALCVVAAVAGGGGVGAATAPATTSAVSSSSTTAPAGKIGIIVERPPASTWGEVKFVEIWPASQPYVEAYRDLVRHELAEHSPALLRRIGLRQVALVRDLAVDGQARAAVPDYPHGVLYLDPWGGHRLSAFQRHIIHHELFHFIQGRVRDDTYFKDPGWIALHDPPFKYGDGGAKMRSPEVSVLFHPAPGFINLYAQSAVEEDMAEVFAAMHVADERAKVEAWAKDDPILRAKIEYMRSLIARYEKGEE